MMNAAIEHTGFKAVLSRFFRTEVDTPFKLGRVLIGGTYGLLLLIVGGPAVLYAMFAIMTQLDWLFNTFIVLFAVVHFAVVYRDLIKDALRTMGNKPKVTPRARVEPQLTQNNPE